MLIRYLVITHSPLAGRQRRAAHAVLALPLTPTPTLAPTLTLALTLALSRRAAHAARRRG